MRLLFAAVVLFACACSSSKSGLTRTRNGLPRKDKAWVFILAGQSNMAGRGVVEPQDTVPSKNIFTMNRNGDVEPAKEPLHFYEPSRTGLDCGLSFARTLKLKIPDNVAVLLVPTAVGGSSISQWIGDSTHRDVKLLTNFTEKVSTAKLVGRVKGILWHQGESDANERDIPLYQSRLATLFPMFRSIVGDANLPIMIGELGSYSANPQRWKMINEQIGKYAATDNRVRVVSTNDFSHKGDSIHFDSKGQRMLGQRFAEAYLLLARQ